MFPATTKRKSFPKRRSDCSGLVAADRIEAESKIFFVDDGSKDRTWSIIDELSRQHTNIAGIKLARNCGHQHALLAGLYTAEGDALVTPRPDFAGTVVARQGSGP